jgi:hypothetical protein
MVNGQKRISFFARDETFSSPNSEEVSLYVKYGRKAMPNRLGIRIFSGCFTGKGYMIVKKVEKLC